jgi:broad specificity phosphatase PhoE
VLTQRGQTQARRLGALVAGLEIDLAVATRLVRTQLTVELALEERAVPLLVEPRFDEIRMGDYDGAPIEDYWAWKEQHGPDEHFPHGESLDEARIRYASGLRSLLSRSERVTLVVVHELALRWIYQGATESRQRLHATFGNTTPYLFDEYAVTRAAAGL